MAMDGHDHHPGLGVGLRPSTPEPSTRFLEATERAALDLGLPSAAKNLGHRPGSALGTMGDNNVLNAVVGAPR